ncbi:hypothetical protein Lokhon_01963 [Limimaricola hongkongensis DSM 17492]|uniref:Uncharacterized protein n=1 Tax=Limimaricola hongkongensis DSM 17492 TaxID=1122180 RepID=A0A017HBK9_9RHOB|nr:hypothetical protein Lokhon_01963 [Limimaricola hongkongensis DSM 17492]
MRSLGQGGDLLMSWRMKSAAPGGGDGRGDLMLNTDLLLSVEHMRSSQGS